MSKDNSSIFKISISMVKNSWMRPVSDTIYEMDINTGQIWVREVSVDNKGIKFFNPSISVND